MALLIIDIGSSSVKALLFDHQANALASVSRSWAFETTPPGASTIEAAQAQQTVEACIDEILTRHPDAPIEAVAFDTFVGNVLGVDGRGRAITPVFTYADTRSSDDVLTLQQQVDTREMHRRTGCMHHTAYQPARLHWLRRVDPALFSAADQWLDVGTYLYRQWFGESPCSYSVASWSGMFNRAALDWDARWLDTLELPKSALPPLADFTEARRGLIAPYATRWRRLCDVPFFLPIGDGAAANVGSGCVDPSRVALSLGTTAALRVASAAELPTVPYGLWGYRIDKRLHLIGGATTEGGSIFRWARETLWIESLESAEGALLARDADAHGLTFLPLLAGERSPGWAVDATGTIDGLRLSTTPLDLLQAALEAVALRLAIIADQLDIPGATVVGSGGALTPLWSQIIADALDHPLHVLDPDTQITARGTAILTLHALGIADLASFPVPDGRTQLPRPEQADRLRAARERQQILYRQLYSHA